MTMSINVKALGAFKKLGAVALITATLAICFTACKQTGGGGGKPTPTPTPKPKHAITFSVDSTTPNGTLKAKADGVAETNTSPISVEEGKTVTFTAKANDGYRVKGWTLDGNAVNGTNNSYSFTVTKPAIVKVSFENNSTPRLKHEVNFSVEGENGTLTAKVDETPITSGDEIEEGKTVTFTATANDFYRVKEWNMDGNVVAGNTSNTYTHSVTKAVEVKVSFELIPTPSVEGEAVLILSPDKLNIKVKVMTADSSAITVEGCNETTLKSDMETELHAKGSKVILKGKIIQLNFSGTYNNNQSLTALDVSGLTSLQRLDCDFNQLTSLNVQGLTSLQELLCSGNQLPELNVQGLTALQELRCSGNQLPELNLQGLTSLQTLLCTNNKLPELNVQDLTSLQTFDCSGNELNNLNVQNCISLKTLWCHGNKLDGDAFTKLLNALPNREASDYANAVLYSEWKSTNEGNCKDFSQPAELKTAFDGAKKKNWKLQKMNASESLEDL